MRIRVFLIAVLMTTSGCAINQGTAMRYNQLGVQAERAENYTLAESNFEKSLLNAELAHSDAHISAAKYNLGRIKGYLCKYDDAEKLLIESLKLEETVTGPDSGSMAMRFLELARLQYDRERFGESVPYYRKGIAVAKKIGVATEDPIALANIVDEFSTALTKTGEVSEAVAAAADAKDLRDRNAGARARFVPVRYPKSCSR